MNESAPVFLWNPTPRDVAERDDRASIVVCIELPRRWAVSLLRDFVGVGIEPFRIVFVGDPLSLDDRTYLALTRRGALLHDVRGANRRARTEQELTAFYMPPARVPTPESNPNPYTYKPGPPVVTPEQLQAHIDAIARRTR